MKSSSNINSSIIFYKNTEKINPININKLNDLMSNGDWGIIEGLNLYNISNNIYVEKGSLLYRQKNLYNNKYDYKYIEITKDFNIELDELEFLQKFVDNTDNEIQANSRYYIVLYPTILEKELLEKYPSYFIKNIDKQINIFLVDKEWLDKNDEYKENIFIIGYLETSLDISIDKIKKISNKEFDNKWEKIRYVRDINHLNELIKKYMINSEQFTIQKLNNFIINDIYSKEKHTDLLSDDVVFYIEPEDWFKGRQINRRGISTNNLSFELLKQIYEKNYVTHSFTNISHNKIMYLNDIIDYIKQIENKGRYKDNNVIHHRQLKIRSESPIYEQSTNLKYEFNLYWDESRSDYHYYDEVKKHYVMKLVPKINDIYHKVLFLINNSEYLYAKYSLNLKNNILFDKLKINLSYIKYIDDIIHTNDILYETIINNEDVINNKFEDTIKLDGLYLSNHFNIDWIKYKENNSIEMDMILDVHVNNIFETYSMEMYTTPNIHDDTFCGSNNLYVGYGNRHNTISHYNLVDNIDTYLLSVTQKKEFADSIIGNDGKLYIVDGAINNVSSLDMIEVDVYNKISKVSGFISQKFLKKSSINTNSIEGPNNRRFIKFGGIDIFSNESNSDIKHINLDNDINYDILESKIPISYKCIDVCKIKGTINYLIYLVKDDNTIVIYKYDKYDNSITLLDNLQIENEIIKTSEQSVNSKSYISDSKNIYTYNYFDRSFKLLYNKPIIEKYINHFIMGDDKKKNVYLFGHYYKILGINTSWTDLLSLYTENPIDFIFKYDYLLMNMDELHDNEKVLKEFDSNYSNKWKFNINERERKEF